MDETKISPDTWKASLRLLNRQKNEPGKPRRVAVLGVGNDLRSDDAAGVRVVRALLNGDWDPDAAPILILEAGLAPENQTAELRRFAPAVVLIVDAADMGRAPGTVQWIQEAEIDGMSASTHSLPISMLARYLTLELNCTVAILGIQVASTEVGENVSAEVLQAVKEVAAELNQWLKME